MGLGDGGGIEVFDQVIDDAGGDGLGASAVFLGAFLFGPKHGVVVRDQSERVGWSAGALERRATIPLVFFVAERKDELHG